MVSFFANKENAAFWRFWAAQLVSQFGDRVHQMALVGLIATRMPGSSFELGKLLAFTIIPVFIIGPVAGVFVDRWDRRMTLFICDVLRGLLVFLVAFWLMNFNNLLPLYAAVFTIFALSRFHVPAKMSFIPRIVKPEDLHVANSLVSVTGMIALVLGALLGGIIVERIGPKGGFVFDAITYFVSAAFVFSIAQARSLRIERERIVSVTKDMVHRQKDVWAEIKEGIGYIRSQRDLSFIIAMMTVLFAAAGAVYIVIIVFVQETFKTITRDLGFLAVPLGVGLFLGSLAYGKWGSKADRFKTIFWSLILGGIMVIVFAGCLSSYPDRLLAAALALVLGLVLGPVTIAANTVVHTVCDDSQSGKVFAALEFVIHAGFLTTMLVSSYLAEHISRVWILSAAGGIFVLVGLAGLIFRRGKKV